MCAMPSCNVTDLDLAPFPDFFPVQWVCVVCVGVWCGEGMCTSVCVGVGDSKKLFYIDLKLVLLVILVGVCVCLSVCLSVCLCVCVFVTLFT